MAYALGGMDAAASYSFTGVLLCKTPSLKNGTEAIF